MLKLNNLSSPKGTHKNIKRIGRGQGSGTGTQAGKGHKGQKARAGGGVRPGFEGGGVALYMKLPKRGFKNAPFKKEYAVLNLSQIDRAFTEGEVTREMIISKGLLKGELRRLPIKILGMGNITKSLVFKGIEKFSNSAKEAIAKVGGTIEDIKKA
ncbi:MAG: 50S ribosomal protein L15 [Bdellovibrionota bacterium]|nr:50S ribosomal protein L15 [Bdellovibrionota bacterium]|tara:strand:- start:1464 stop:1928 length:465 start_codon:yes stop_codon:yes gene_type:complete